MLRTDIDLLGRAAIFFIVTKYKQWETIWEWCISCTVWSYLFTSEVSIPPPKLHNPLYSISNCSLNTPISSWTIPFYLSLPLPNTTFAPGYPMNSPDILSSLLVTQVLFGLPFYIRSPPQPTSPQPPQFLTSLQATCSLFLPTSTLPWWCYHAWCSGDCARWFPFIKLLCAPSLNFYSIYENGCWTWFMPGLCVRVHYKITQNSALN